MNDEFGGVLVDEGRDEFGGIPVETDAFGGVAIADTSAEEAEILSRPAVPAYITEHNERPGEIGLHSTMTPWQRFRASELGHKIFGPTDIERESSDLRPGGVGLLELPQKALQFSTVPPQLANPIREEIEKALARTDQTPHLKGMIRGGADLVLNFPIAPIPVYPKAVLTVFGSEYAWHLPEQKRAYNAALERGDTETATQIAVNAVGSGALLSYAAAHSAGMKFNWLGKRTDEALVVTDQVPMMNPPLNTRATEAGPAAQAAIREPVPAEPLPPESFSEPFQQRRQGAAIKEAASEGAAAVGPETQAEVARQEIIGMGGAVPSEFAPGRQTATGIKNAQVDAERQARGQPPIMGPQRLRNEVVWDAAMSKIDLDPGWQDRLIAELKEAPHTPSAQEIVALDHRYSDILNEFSKSTREGAQAYEDGRMEDVADARSRAEFFERQLTEIEEVARKVGTEWGRSGQMRQRLIREDFTLAAMEARLRAAKGFEPLTEAEHAEVAALHERLAEAQKAAEQSAQTAEERTGTTQVEEAVSEAKAGAVPAKVDVPKAIEDARLSIAEKIANGTPNEIFNDVQKLVKALVSENPKIARDELIDRVHGILKESLPEITRLETMDAISGRGRFTLPSQDEVIAAIRDLKEQIRLVGHQEDVQAGKPLPRTGYQRGKMSEAARREQQKLNELKKRYGVETTDPEAQLASALQARKTYYRNRLADLKEEIRTRTRIVERKGKSPTDAELEALKLEYDRVKAEHAQIFQKPGLTLEQRLTLATAAAERSLESWNKRLDAAKRGDFSRTTQPKVTSARIDAIKSQIESIKAEVDALRKLAHPGKTPEEKALAIIKARLAREEADLQRRLDTGDFSPRRKGPSVALDAETTRAKARVELLKAEYNRRVAKAKYEAKTIGEKIWAGIKEALNLPRALKTSLDVSAVLRQGGFVVLGNPARGARNLAPMFKALASKENAAVIEQEIRSRPNASLYERAKLHLSALEETNLSRMEESFMSKLAGRIPGVSHSQRAYITFLNRLRADTFDSMLRNLTKKGEATQAELEAIANYVNVATGRGNIGSAAGAAKTLATIFFAPRLVASRFQLLAGEPLYRGSARTRFLIAQEYGRFLAGLATVYGLAQLAGGEVETDSRSADFGKIRFGNTRVDPMAGLSQVTVLTSRLAQGETKDSRGRVHAITGEVPYGSHTAVDVMTRFLRSKLAPVPGAIIDVRTGSNVVGEPVTPGDAALSLVEPLAFSDILSAMEDQGVERGTALAILSLFGMSLQTYETRKQKE